MKNPFVQKDDNIIALFLHRLGQGAIILLDFLDQQVNAVIKYLKQHISSSVQPPQPQPQPAPLPQKEEQRQQNLDSYNILDTLPEGDFDDITTLASQICGTKIALISLLDRDRQWFKSKQGLDADETPRDWAFCAHAILNPDEVLVVPNARKDKRFARNPLVLGDPNIQFYAGAPLVTPEGHALGTLCAIDQKPHKLSPEQVNALQALSRQVMGQMELRRNIRNLETEVNRRKKTEFALQRERQKADTLLRNILPAKIAHKLKQNPGLIAQAYDSVTILFADLVNFTEFSSQTSPQTLVATLNKIFSEFDALTDKYQLEKIKTIGDAYMVAGGLPQPSQTNATAIANMALEMQAVMERHQQEYPSKLSLRIGINTGPVVAGVIGQKKFAYDLWGDAVNVASRMEMLGVEGKIQVTDNTYQLLKNQFHFEDRGTIDVKGKGEMPVYFLMGKQENVSCNL
ncbi:adenylate/guanylate cyclase domain-containing protein [Spirulina sp. CS-785/01]|uniref:adenylate/guanylate cyclase domain-containing protein n=1 Tax=Spirulina sp. CS-785/01 TaxID=3021716 RepID=UPI00232BC641|nr:adenylate/guanylate cyclase domain-containing protein [Spirulina sp. CS-785/01]MDB9312547.1 adenylate/guanylate cyclase domain-containing protein [Spirulina sp. CS-785/01]